MTQLLATRCSPEELLENHDEITCDLNADFNVSRRIEKAKWEYHGNNLVAHDVRLRSFAEHILDIVLGKEDGLAR